MNPATPRDGRCPEPKPVTILILTSLGVLSGLASGSIPFVQTLDVSGYRLAAGSAFISGSAAFAAVLALGLARRTWRRVIVALALAFTLVGGGLYWSEKQFDLFHPHSVLFAYINEEPPWVRTFRITWVTIFPSWWKWGLGVGVPGSVCLTLAHHVGLSHGLKKSLAAYALAGMGGLSLYWFHWIFFYEENPFQAVKFTVFGWIMGLIFGLSQWAGMALAKKIDALHRRASDSGIAR